MNKNSMNSSKNEGKNGKLRKTERKKAQRTPKICNKQAKSDYPPDTLTHCVTVC